MNKTIRYLAIITGAASLVCVASVSAQTHKRASAPIVITPPAVHDGSSWSRAPFPAARPQNDVTPPNGEAFDENVPPNTPSTTPAPEPPPPATVAILQPRVEPGLMPTGRPSVGASVALDATHVEPAIRNATFESRDNLVDGIRVRMRNSENTLMEFRRTEKDMNASGREQFQSAADDVRARDKALRKSLRAAENASATNWDAARAQLATDYEAYAGALARVDTALGMQADRR